MHQQKPDFKKMTEAQRKEFLKGFKKTAAQTKRTWKPIKPTYLELNKTSRMAPAPVMDNDALNKSMKKYHAHINRMVALGFSNPTEPSFRDDVISNMKNLYELHPDQLIPMHEKDWVVDAIVQKVYAKKRSADKKAPIKQSKSTTMKAAADAKKTKQMFDARRKAIAEKRKRTAMTASVNRPKKSENTNNHGFNMNVSDNNANGKSASNSNNMSNSNTDNMKPMSNNDVKKLMNDLKRLNMSVVRV